MNENAEKITPENNRKPLDPKYTLKTDKDDSDFEDAQKNHFKPIRPITERKRGWNVRLFSTDDRTKQLEVVSTDTSEAQRIVLQRTRAFYNAHYPDFHPSLFEFAQQHQQRLILPSILAITYADFGVDLCARRKLQSSVYQIKLIRSCIAELMKLHAKGFVFLGLKPNKILFNEPTCKSYLIDGDFVVLQTDPLPPEFTVNPENLAQVQKSFYHIAPECWSTAGSEARPCMPNPAMDIYSLGQLFSRSLFKNLLDSDVQVLMTQCLQTKPTSRPTLQQLDEALSTLESKRVYKGFAHYQNMLTPTDSPILKNLIRWIASDYLVGNKIKFALRDAEREKRQCHFDTLSPQHQALYLSLAGLILIDYLATKRFAELNLKLDGWDVSSVGNEFCLRRMPQQNTISSTDSMLQYAWVLDKAACEENTKALVASDPELVSFELDLKNPLQTSIDLWRHQLVMLSQRQSQVDDGRSDESSCVIA